MGVGGPTPVPAPDQNAELQQRMEKDRVVKQKALATAVSNLAGANAKCNALGVAITTASKRRDGATVEQAKTELASALLDLSLAKNREAVCRKALNQHIEQMKKLEVIASSIDTAMSLKRNMDHIAAFAPSVDVMQDAAEEMRDHSIAFDQLQAATEEVMAVAGGADPDASADDTSVEAFLAGFAHSHMEDPESELEGVADAGVGPLTTWAHPKPTGVSQADPEALGDGVDWGVGAPSVGWRRDAAEVPRPAVGAGRGTDPVIGLGSAPLFVPPPTMAPRPAPRPRVLLA